MRMVFCLVCTCFFFKQKTAYVMRISDWSSDVCSSRFILLLAWGIAAGVTGLLVLMALLAWRLSQGPVALGFLVPTIERALSQPDRGLFVCVDRVIVDSIGFLRFEAEGVRVVDGAGVSVVGTPHIRLALSSRALARGIVAPREIPCSGVGDRL